MIGITYQKKIEKKLKKEANQQTDRKNVRKTNLIKYGWAAVRN